MEYAEGQIRRLLSGQVELWELPLTGGLWRVTGAQVAQAAAAEGAPGPAAAAVSEEEVRGPHASLAVRLQVCHASGQLTVHFLAGRHTCGLQRCLFWMRTLYLPLLSRLIT